MYASILEKLKCRISICVLLTVVAWINLSQFITRDNRIHGDWQRLEKELREINAPHTYDKRYAGLRAVLTSTDTIGYVSTVSSGSVLNSVNSAADYFQTQYALAPLIVVNSTEYPFVVGNFNTLSPDVIPSFIKFSSVLEDFGNGAFLLKRSQ